MMLNNASRGCSYNGVMACHVTDYTADGCAFQATFGGPSPRKQCERRGHYYSYQYFAHFCPLIEHRFRQNPSAR
jgi:hypothetical protein